MAEVESLEIQIKAASTDAVDKINNLAQALEKLKTVAASNEFSNIANKLKAIGNINRQIKLDVDPKSGKEVDALTGKVRALLEAVKQVNATAVKIPNIPKSGKTGATVDRKTPQKTENPLKIVSELERTDKQLEKTKKLVEELQKQYDELQKKQGKGSKNTQAETNQALAETSTKLREQTALYDQLLKRREELSRMATAGQPDAGIDAGPSGGVDVTAQKIGILERARDAILRIGEAARDGTGPIGKIGEIAGGVALKGFGALESVLKKIPTGLKTFGKFIKKELTSPFTSAVKKFGEWKNAIGRVAFYRIIRGAIKMVTDGFKEGTDNLYQYSRLVGTEFAPAMDTLASEFTYLKNSLGAVAAPLIQAIVPAVRTVIDSFVDLLNVIGRAMAALTGKTVYSQAKKYADEYADAAGDAGKATDEFKRYLIGIDELNVISEPNKGGGGSGTGEDYGSMFEEVPVEPVDWAEKIREAIENGDWALAGQTLAEKLNGLVSSFNAVEFGGKIGEQIDHGIQAAYGFLENLDFGKIGVRVGGLITGAFAEIDFSDLGALFVRGLTYLPDLIIGGLVGLDWGLVAKSISDFIIGAFDEGTRWLNSWDWSSLGSTLWQKLKDAVTNIDFAGIATSLFTFLGTAIRSAIDFLGGFISGIGADIKAWWDEDIAGENWIETAGNILSAIAKGFADIGGWVMENIVDPFMEGLLGEDVWADTKKVGEDIINGIWDGITSFLSDPLGWLKEHLVDPIVDGVKKLLGIHSPSTVFSGIGSDLIAGLLEGISQTWSDIVSFFSEKAEGIRKTLEGAWDGIKEAWNTASTWFDENVIQPVGKFFDGLFTDIGTWASEKWTGIQETWNNAGTWFDENVTQPVGDFFSGLWEDVGLGAEGGWDDSSLAWEDAPTWFSDNITGPIFDVFDAMFGDNTQSSEDAVEPLEEPWKPLADWFGENVKEPVGEKFSTLWDDVKSWASGAWDNIKKTFSDVSGWFDKNLIQPVKNGFKSFMNSLIGFAEGFVNFFIRGINGIIGAFNRLSIHIPDNPITGKLDIGFNIAKVPEIKLPRLAEGAVIPPNREFMAVLGDQKSGTNVEAPLKTIQTAVVQALNTIQQKSARGTYASAIAPTAPYVQAPAYAGPAGGQMDRRSQEEVISVIFAAAQQIVTAIRDKDLDVYYDGEKVTRHVESLQKQYDRMYRR